MKLSKLLGEIEYTCIQGEIEVEISSLVYDSRKAGPGCVFVCMTGARSDGHDYIEEVAARGAAAVVIQKDVSIPEGLTVIRTADTRLALACMSAAYFGHPARELTVIGITGTKGKTTTAYMVRSIMEHAGIPTGLIGTIETIVKDEVILSDNTTPESYLIQEYFRKMADAGLRAVVMEVSSQGLMLHRTSGFLFDFGVFMNIEPDHIGPGEHKDFEDYMRCKGLLFQACRIGIANADDPRMEQVLKGHTCELETFGTAPSSDLYAQEIDLHSRLGSLGVTFRVKGRMEFAAEVDIPGKFTVYNALAAIAVCRHFDIRIPVIQEALRTIRVKGRAELVPISNRFTLMIDYAHNAMSLKSLLTTLREYQPKRLVCLFGCGGNRSRDRRYEMGEISGRMADYTVVTSDNPRYEEPQAIIDDIIVGVKRGGGAYTAICDRKEAIRYCILHAQDGDVIVLAGKGHEDYQEIKGVKYPMDERVLIREILSEMTEEERAGL